MKYFGGCDVGSTYAKCVILDENGKMVADATVRSKINPVQSAELALGEAIGKVDGINSAEDLSYLIGTGYGRNKVPFADENISEISCHAMGVHVTNPAVKAIIDIGGQDVKGIAIDTDGTVKNFANALPVQVDFLKLWQMLLKCLCLISVNFHSRLKILFLSLPSVPYLLKVKLYHL